MIKPTSPPIRVLLADDHAVVRAGIRQFLETAGDIQVVAEADDGASAQALIEQYQPDVAVLDIQMPRASGIEVTRWIRSRAAGPDKEAGQGRLRNTGVLILTAFDDDPYILAVLQAGANGYVLKTASPTEIIQAVRDVYAGKSALDASVARKLFAQVAGHAMQSRTSLPVERLTGREMEVLIMAAKGYTNKAIGIQLGISDRTVQGHLAHIFAKLQATSRTEAVMRAVSLHWIPQDLGSLTEDGT